MLPAVLRTSAPIWPGGAWLSLNTGSSGILYGMVVSYFPALCSSWLLPTWSSVLCLRRWDGESLPALGWGSMCCPYRWLTGGMSSSWPVGASEPPVCWKGFWLLSQHGEAVYSSLTSVNLSCPRWALSQDSSCERQLLQYPAVGVWHARF